MLLNEIFYPDWRSAVWTWSRKDGEQWVGQFETDNAQCTVTIGRHPIKDFLRSMTGPDRENLSSVLDTREFLWLVDIKSEGQEDFPVVFNTIHYMIREFMSQMGPNAMVLCFSDKTQARANADIVRRYAADWNITQTTALGKHCYVLYHGTPNQFGTKDNYNLA